MAPRTSVPVLLLTGFLGSGKTSLLARWLKDEAFAGALVIVNELGEVGIDDRLVETSSEAPMLLENGCVCCAGGEDLMATLERLFWDRLHRKIPKFSWVLIETTGLADPAPIVERMGKHALVSERYRLAGVVTTFDARMGPAQLARHPEVAAQIRAARAVVLTKTDIATHEEIAAARAAIAGIRAGAEALSSSRSDLSAGAVIAALAHADAAPAGGETVAAHSQNVTTAFVPVTALVEVADITAALMQMLTRHGGALLRLKGIVRLAPDGELQGVQAMPGVGVEFTPVSADAPETVKTGLTIIAQNTTARTIAGALQSILDTQARDARMIA